MKTSIKDRFKNFLGPYEINIGLLYFTLVSLEIFQLRPETYRYAYGYPRVHFFLSGVLIIFILSIPFLLSLLASRKYWNNRSKSFKQYILEVSILILILNLSQLIVAEYFISFFGIKNFLRMDNFLFIDISRTFFALLIIAFTHNRERDLKKKIFEAESINALLAAKYRKLIDVDEQIRSQVAKLLHDRIQSDLMLASSKLGLISESLSPSMSKDLQEIQKSLERLRKTDIRKVSQILVPNLDGEGLIGACENLISDFGNGVKFNLEINEDLEILNKDLKLGVYRIIEQGINNSIKHGPAGEITVKLGRRSADKIILEVIDNGPGTNGSNIGTGTIIIDSWISTLGATKHIEATPGFGYTLRVTIPSV